MTYDIKDKSAIITGSAQGIGKCICYQLLKKGAKVNLLQIRNCVISLYYYT